MLTVFVFLDHKRIVSLNCSSLNEQMVVEWETDDLEVNRYVVEWYWELEKESYKRSWQYIDDTNWISQKGTFFFSFALLTDWYIVC